MLKLCKLLFLNACAVGAIAGTAQAGTIIAGTTDIFLASQPNGTPVTGFFGPDTAPGNSPVQFLVTGSVLTFSATGSTSVDGSCYAGPDGGCYADESGFSPAPASGTYKGPSDALIGVFLGPGVTDVAAGLASLDFTDPTNTSLASQSPLINQIFFIGDGLTGTGTGSVQDFIAPVGATDLYLAVADSIGGSNNNLGSLDVTVTGATQTAVPEPFSLSLFGAGLVGAMVIRRRKKKAA
jgi:hypothetical protein